MSKKLQAAAEETKKQLKWNGALNKQMKSDFVDMMGWVLSSTGLNVDLAEWRIACGFKPHRD